jgi:AcrR family transcriptional regulator
MSMYAKRTKPRAQTRERVVGAVRELLAEGTFHESTVEQVATRAGVSRASLYQHFGSRVGLVDALCETFDATRPLLAIRETESVDEFIALVVEFWSAEEKILEQLYGVAAVDPAARDLVERQTRDRYGELRRLQRALGVDSKDAFAELAMLTSFETYRELRRRVGLSKRGVVTRLQAAAARAVGSG